MHEAVATSARVASNPWHCYGDELLTLLKTTWLRFHGVPCSSGSVQGRAQAFFMLVNFIDECAIGLFLGGRLAHAGFSFLAFPFIFFAGKQVADIDNVRHVCR